jgi:hypothetical protein
MLNLQLLFSVSVKRTRHLFLLRPDQMSHLLLVRRLQLTLTTFQATHLKLKSMQQLIQTLNQRKKNTLERRRKRNIAVEESLNSSRPQQRQASKASLEQITLRLILALNMQRIVSGYFRIPKILQLQDHSILRPVTKGRRELYISVPQRPCHVSHSLRLRRLRILTLFSLLQSPTLKNSRRLVGLDGRPSW